MISRGLRFSFPLYLIIFVLLNSTFGNKVFKESDKPGVTVRTNCGEVAGTQYRTFMGRKVHVFYSIPYAKPPMGELRFKPPVPIEPWNGTKQSDGSLKICAQYNHHLLPEKSDGVVGSEDCLYLHVFTPRTFNREKLMPVTVYIHGGAFMYGMGIPYKPRFLLRHTDTVYVSINYRVGPLGFLSTEDDVVPGNNGLRDQVLALKWVRDNIIHFGGDASKVTIAGTGAGAASVHLHYFSKQSRSLFRQGISMNGCALNPWALMKRGKEKAQRLAAALECPTNNSQEMVDCLRQIPAWDILRQIKPLFMSWLSFPISVFGPTIERAGEDPFLNEHPYKMLLKGDFKDANWLVNFAYEEGLYACDQFSTKPNLIIQLDKQFETIAPHLFDFNYTVEPSKLKNVSQNVRLTYFPSGPIAMRYRKYIIEMICDRLFVSGISKAVKLQSSRQKLSKVYVFKMSYTSPKSMTVSVNEAREYYGATHCEDLLFSFGCYYYPFADGSSDERMAEALAQLWNQYIHNSTNYFRILYNNWVSVNDVKFGGFTPYLNMQFPYSIKVMHTDNLANGKQWDSWPIKENEQYDEKCYFSV